MLQIGVCDDDSRMASMYTQAAEESLRQCGAVGRVLSYTDSRNLLWDITEDGFFFDILLLDIEMPGVTGMELAEKIRDVLPDIRIIFITSIWNMPLTPLNCLSFVMCRKTSWSRGFRELCVMRSVCWNWRTAGLIRFRRTAGWKKFRIRRSFL